MLGNLHTASRAIRSRTTRTRAQASLSGRELRYWVLCFVTGRSGTSVLLYQEASRRQTASCCGSGTSVSEKTSRRPCSRRLRLRQYSMDVLRRQPHKNVAASLVASCCGSGSLLCFSFQRPWLSVAAAALFVVSSKSMSGFLVVQVMILG